MRVALGPVDHLAQVLKVLNFQTVHTATTATPTNNTVTFVLEIEVLHKVPVVPDVRDEILERVRGDDLVVRVLADQVRETAEVRAAVRVLLERRRALLQVREVVVRLLQI